MTNTDKKQFARLWVKEYEATVKLSQLNDKREFYRNIGKPTGMLSRSIESWEKKQTAALDSIEAGIKEGKFDQNTPDECRELLGDLCGYVCDCYHDCLIDAGAL